MNHDQSSIKSLVMGLVDDVGQLFRKELQLAQAEASEKFSQAQRGLFAIVAGMLLAFSALLVLLQALVIALSNVMAPWLASVIVGVGVAIVAAILVSQGQNNLKATSLKPERTVRSVRQDKDMVMERVR